MHRSRLGRWLAVVAEECAAEHFFSLNEANSWESSKFYTPAIQNSAEDGTCLTRIAGKPTRQRWLKSGTHPQGQECFSLALCPLLCSWAQCHSAWFGIQLNIVSDIKKPEKKRFLHPKVKPKGTFHFRFHLLHCMPCCTSVLWIFRICRKHWKVSFQCYFDTIRSMCFVL